MNYLYALLEVESRIACLTVGLDPGLGVLHADQRARDSLALDLMEVVRPMVDAYVLDLLTSRVFTRDDIFETRQGNCRLLPPLTERLASTTRSWAKAIAPWAEWTARRLLAGRTSERSADLPTPLTGANRRAGRGKVLKATVPVVPKPVAVCRACGVVLEDQQRRYCDDCLPHAQLGAPVAFLQAGPAELARLRAEGTDPAHRG